MPFEAADLDARLRRMIAGRAGEGAGGDAEVSESADAESDSAPRSEGPVDPEPHYPAMMADALMDLVRSVVGDGATGRRGDGATGRRGDGATGTWCMSWCMRTVGSRCFGGPPLSPGAAAAVRCDAGSVAHVVDGSGAPLRLGRRHHELVHAGWRITGDPPAHCASGGPPDRDLRPCSRRPCPGRLAAMKTIGNILWLLLVG